MEMKMEMKQRVVNNLKILMAAHGMDKKELSSRSGVSPRMVSYILNEERVPSLDVIDSLAKAFRIDGWELTSPYIDEMVDKGLEVTCETWISLDDDGAAVEANPEWSKYNGDQKIIDVLVASGLVTQEKIDQIRELLAD